MYEPSVLPPRYAGPRPAGKRVRDRRVAVAFWLVLAAAPAVAALPPGLVLVGIGTFLVWCLAGARDRRAPEWGPAPADRGPVGGPVPPSTGPSHA